MHATFRWAIHHDSRLIVRLKDGGSVTVDLGSQTVTAPDGATHHFDVDPFRKQALLSGQDEIALTLSYETEIAAFEARHAREMSWLG